MIGAAKIMFKSSAGASGGANGYFCGGATAYNSVAIATADMVTFSTDVTAAAAGSNLVQARLYPASLGNTAKKGYFLGGATDTGPVVATISGLTFATGAVSAVGAVLSQARGESGSVSQSATKGFVSGGQTGIAVATADKFTYATEADAVAATANLSAARYGPASVTEGVTKGYIAGGGYPGVVTADKVTFATDSTAAQASANLANNSYAGAGVNGGTTKGYFAGGLESGVGYTAKANKVTFATDATAAVATANLSSGRSKIAGLTEGTTKGYFAGGITSDYGATMATTDKVTFATDTTAASAVSNLSGGRCKLCGVGDTGR